MRQSNRQYFEAVIQLRPENKELLSFVLNQIAKHPDVFISHEIHKNYGTDIYISSRKFAMLLAKRLKRSFKGELITSRTLYSMDRQSGKGVYRITVCFKLAVDKKKEPIEHLD